MAKEEKEKKNFKNPGRLFFVAAGVFLFGALAFAFVFTYQKSHEGKIYDRVWVGETELSKATIDLAKLAMSKEFNDKYDQGFVFVYGDKREKTLNDYEVLLGVEAQMAAPDFEKTAQDAFGVGRSGNVLIDLKDQLFGLIFGKRIDLSFSLNRDYLIDQLKEAFGEFEDNARSAEIEVSVKSKVNKEMEVKIIPEKEGVGFDYEKYADMLADKITRLDNSDISMKLEKQSPAIKAADAGGIAQKTTELVADNDEINFVFEDQKWTASWYDYVSWLALDKADKNEVILTFDKTKFEEFLQPIIKEINIAPKNARFELADGKVTEFQLSKNGREINIDQTFDGLINLFFKSGENEIKLAVEEKLPDVNTENIADMGIRELIGSGTSNFSGSPANRRYNIKIGSNSLHGILIKPGEEFSLVKNLGRIDGSTGYLPELVIRGNKTVPEFGGGLCQVATTMFRAAIDTGLPVTERKPHSYRVSYYEPAGTDATIYDPSPDLKFINDTGQYILIQTAISGDTLTYEFWGTFDGRTVEVTEPKIFNITYPGPTKEIESPDLAPGVRKCTERAHNGADAVFYRIITPASGDAINETWSSTYRPWQAVCLVGPSEAPVEESSSDAPVTPEN
ncbi:MAG TPA: VanW family protein [Candidatus Bipolaricaulota bacterium]|nr:VanW family protein [Candidatus Bipolaricaulota bacterium]